MSGEVTLVSKHCFGALILSGLLTVTAWAEDKAAVTRALAACGPDDFQFDVKTDKHRHPIAQPETGKATVYVIEDQGPECVFCAATIRLGMDGAWVGANHGRSYFFFTVQAGEHHLCADWQRLPPVDKVVSLAHFTAEAGKTYYFSTRLTSGYAGSGYLLDLQPMDSDEAQFLIASYAFSTWKLPNEPAESGGNSQNP